MKDYSETRLQIAVVSYLRGEIRSGKLVIQVQKPFDCIFLHPVNEYKDEKEAYWAKSKGILPGAPDLLFWWTHAFGAIELKTKSSLSATQKAFQHRFMEIGGRFAICKKVSEVRDTLLSWGLPCKNHQTVEPKLSHEELLAFQTEMYKQ